MTANEISDSIQKSQKEIATISAIISHNYLNSLLTSKTAAGDFRGFFESIDVIADTAVEFYNIFETGIQNPKFEWSTIYGEEIDSYEDVILFWAGQHIKDKYAIHVRISQ